MLHAFVIQFTQDSRPYDSLWDLGLRLVLSSVFLVSGVGKVWDLKGTRQALSDFGVPDSFTSLGARFLPVLEVALGVGLVFDVSYCLSALGAAGLSLVFVAGISNLLRQGRTPPCHCFGAIQSAPVGLATLVRALLLFIASLTCFFREGIEMTASVNACVLAGGGVMLVLSGASNVVLWKRVQKGYRKAKGLRVGQRFPALRLLDGRWASDLLAKDRRSFIVVTSTGCGVCKEVKIHLSRWRETVSGDLAILELQASHGPLSAEDAESEAVGVHYFLSTEMENITIGAPSAILVDQHGVLLASPVVGPEEVEALLRMALSSR